MKTKVEINGYEIEIEFVDGVINVSASKDDEIVEEFSIETEESEEGEEVQGFGEFGQEEEDFEGEEFGQDDEEGQDDEDEDDDIEDQRALESFQSFLRKNKTK